MRTTNKKQRTIKACEALAWKYRHPEGRRFFNCETCSLCQIHCEYPTSWKCAGCPLANENGECGCNKFESFKKAGSAHEQIMMCKNINGLPSALNKRCKAFALRAQFFDRILPIIKAWPESRFTKKGWRYSGDEIPRSW